MVNFMFLIIFVIFGLFGCNESQTINGCYEENGDTNTKLCFNDSTFTVTLNYYGIPSKTSGNFKIIDNTHGKMTFNHVAIGNTSVNKEILNLIKNNLTWVFTVSGNCIELPNNSGIVTLYCK